MKRGDKVKILSSTLSDEIPQMEEMIGQVFEIYRCMHSHPGREDIYYIYDIEHVTTWCFDESELELVEEC